MSRKIYSRTHHPVMKAALVIVAVLIAVPLLILVVWSLNSMWQYPDVIPHDWTLRGFESLLTGSTDFFGTVGTSFLITILVCLLSVVIGTLTAQALVFHDFKGKQLIDFLVYLPALVPAVVFGIGAHLIFISMNLNNTVFAVIIGQLMVSMPYAIKIVTNATRMLGVKCVEQAIVLGSTPLKAYFQVSFHLLVPSLISAMCMAFTASFCDYFITFILGGGQVRTFAIAVFPLIGGSDMNLASAYSLVYMLLGFAFFLVLEWISRKITKKQTMYLM